ncbi:MarR family transcriptional regulator [Gelidibacter salicanalis]|uniref:MarR family transcriptional regulator n=1 Tax=Gelidibacter salicanalis TaxID=291193 RepID=A0A934KXJ7_9FLAO|nr:MarR family transcriptional regulator [Gelidibacter salicanalis]MBJ7882402.1 MarR family transcriptional regulator [Gelidibacter salicanalis]
MKELEDIIKTKTDIALAKKTVLNISLTNVNFKDSISHVLKSFDISIEQFNVLRILRGQHGKPTNLQDIQDRMVSKMSNTTRLVDKLILKGFVERFICEDNRRKVEIFITKKGLEALQSIDPKVLLVETELTAALSIEELTTLNTLLTKLRK